LGGRAGCSEPSVVDAGTTGEVVGAAGSGLGGGVGVGAGLVGVVCGGPGVGVGVGAAGAPGPGVGLPGEVGVPCGWGEPWEPV
jgi:hypothetical protein